MGHVGRRARPRGCAGAHPGFRHDHEPIADDIVTQFRHCEHVTCVGDERPRRRYPAPQRGVARAARARSARERDQVSRSLLVELRDAECRDPGWRSRGEHVRERRRDPRRGRHARRTRHRRRRRAPLGLHPVEGTDRDRWRAARARPRALDGPLGFGSPRRRRAARARRVDRGSPASVADHRARVAAGSGDRGERAVQGTARAGRRHPVGPGGDHRRLRRRRDRVAAADPRLRHHRPRAHPHHPRRLSAAGDPGTRDRDRLGRHRCRVHPPLRLARLAGHAAGLASAGAAHQGRRGRRRPRGRLPRAG